MESKKVTIIGSMVELNRIGAKGDTPRTCDSCKYRAKNRTCNYSGITGHTRLGRIAQQLGKSSGEEWKQAIKVENCTLWEPRRKGALRKQMKPPAPSVRYDNETGKYYKRMNQSEARELIKAGYGNRQIAAMKGWNPKDVAEFRLTVEPKQKTTDCLRKVPVRFDHGRAFEFYSAGKSDEEIADIFGCKARSIRSWRNREGLPEKYDGREPPLKQGQKGKLTERQAKRAAELWEAGGSDARIADVLGVPESRARSWRLANDLRGGATRGEQ